MAQQYTEAQRKQAETMLQDVSSDVKQHYFDPLALGSGWESKVRAVKEEIDRADSMNRALGYLAALLDGLGDSHTYFLPPPRSYRHDYGFQMEMVGDRCLVTRVRPGSDAEKRGLRAGDQILTVDGYAPSRDDIWRMHYLFWILQPQESLRVGVRTGTGSERQVQVEAHIRQLASAPDPTGSAMFEAMREIETRHEAQLPSYAERGNRLLIVKAPDLTLSELEVDGMLARMEKHEAVVLDLRGNPGGSEAGLRSLLGGLFAKPVEIGELVSSRSTTTLETQPHHRSFTGKLAVLIDSESGSAAEVFARVVQLTKRGVVLGDRSAGRAMAAQEFLHQQGLGNAVVYGTSVTEAEIRMADGQSLERNGVVPDAVILPSPGDLAEGRDPLLAAAAERLQVPLSAQQAGGLLPYRWSKD